MTISFFTDLLRLIARVFTMFQPLMWLLAMAIICSIVTIIKYLCSLKG